ncbi:unnamed protein product [Adineta ricciae]|uniref:Uncharacterized protein n=1 Tax=Adineta ricciae TaxID=249248 RepID=A0A813XVZ6_ADIRI|nr:unnamed protein product [Adineta ricciae]CAF1172336.1 unnamed protein product [Adineta ricciae]
MFRLPSPPRFTLPPPPMLPPGILTLESLQLTCSSIEFHPKPNSFLLTSIILVLIVILLILLYIFIRYLLKLQSSTNSVHRKVVSPISRHSSIGSSRSYETISSGIYLESVNISPTADSHNFIRSCYE